MLRRLRSSSGRPTRMEAACSGRCAWPQGSRPERNVQAHTFTHCFGYARCTASASYAALLLAGEARGGCPVPQGARGGRGGEADRALRARLHALHRSNAALSKLLRTLDAQLESAAAALPEPRRSGALADLLCFAPLLKR